MVQPSINPAMLPRAGQLPCTWTSTPRNHDMRGQEQLSNGYIRVYCLYCGQTEAEIQAAL